LILAQVLPKSLGINHRAPNIRCYKSDTLRHGRGRQRCGHTRCIFRSLL
jgi:hypothetical protein